jgi:hypothetical protein
LIAAREVDDFQPHRAERRSATFEDALLVGSAMAQGFDDAARDIPVGQSVERCKSRNATHLKVLSPAALRSPPYDKPGPFRWLKYSI